jgi:cytosine/uracil/thiamine/allantoin permease
VIVRALNAPRMPPMISSAKHVRFPCAVDLTDTNPELVQRRSSWTAIIFGSCLMSLSITCKAYYLLSFLAIYNLSRLDPCAMNENYAWGI